MKVLSFISKSTVTELGLFDDGIECLCRSVAHSPNDLNTLLTPEEQGRFRYEAICRALQEEGRKLYEIDMVITQGGIQVLPPGIYLVNRELLALLADEVLEERAVRAGAFTTWFLADQIQREFDVECMALFVEPAIENELIPEATLSGMKGITREPIFHAFSHRAATSLYAWKAGKTYYDVNVVIAHLGTEISVGAYQKGRIIDSNSPLDGEGPFSPTTSGTLPTDAFVRLCFSGKYDMDEALRMIAQEGGLTAHLGYGKLQRVQSACDNGDQKAIFMVKAMAYKIAREIGARAAALRGEIDQIILTGPWAVFPLLTAEITERVSWIAPTTIHIWESELFMLATAGIETYRGNSPILLYGMDRA